MKNSGVNLALFVGNMAAVGLSLNCLPAFAIGNEARSYNLSNWHSSQSSLFNSLSDLKIAQSCGGRYYRTISNRQIEQMLDCLNIPYNKEWNDVYKIYLNGYDESYNLTLENCSNDNCRIGLLAGLFVERSNSRRIGQWNNYYRDKYNTRASLNRRGYVVIQSYLSLERGIESDDVRDFIAAFEASLDDFAEYIEITRY